MKNIQFSILLIVLFSMASLAQPIPSPVRLPDCSGFGDAAEAEIAIFTDADLIVVPDGPDEYLPEEERHRRARMGDTPCREEQGTPYWERLEAIAAAQTPSRQIYTRTPEERNPEPLPQGPTEMNATALEFDEDDDESLDDDEEEDGAYITYMPSLRRLIVRVPNSPDRYAPAA